MNEQAHILTAILTPDGLKPTPYTAASLHDAIRYEPAGVYTVTRTFHRTGALELDAHLARLEESARLTGIPVQHSRAAIRTALRTLIERAGYPETRFRITIAAETPEQVYFALEPLTPVPESVKRDGVAVQTFAARRANPAAKSTSWMASRAALQVQMRPGMYEGLLVDSDGTILEGFSSNFYAILGGRLRTAGAGILNGISRRIVLEVAPEIVPVEEQAVTLADIPALSEAFLTSSSRGVIPIVAIDDIPIGTGTPGPLTRRISAAYDAWAEKHIEPI
ncbi:MAG: hypothetical protein HPY64_17135 [Anaerolineae bacterium]|nr:hypothetical protein [Anaerolineae bacterium]